MGNPDVVLASIYTLLPLAEGRSQNPDDGGGILVILGVIAVMVIVILTAWTLIARATSKRRGRASGTGG
jgi:hypothetical protein